MLARLFVVWNGGIQELTCVQCIPRGLIDMLKAVRAEESTAKISGDYDENVVDFLEKSKGGDLDDRMVLVSHQNLQQVSQSTACSSLPVIVVIYQPMNGIRVNARMIRYDRPWCRTLPT